MTSVLRAGRDQAGLRPQQGSYSEKSRPTLAGCFAPFGRSYLYSQSRSNAVILVRFRSPTSLSPAQ